MKKLDSEKLSYWFKRKLPEELDDGSEYPLLLTVIGERPGALTMNIDQGQEEVLEEFCKEFELCLRIGRGRKSKPHRKVQEKVERKQRGAFIFREESRIEILDNSEGRFYGFSDEAVGEFLGFPDEAIEFFTNHDQPAALSRKFMESEIDFDTSLTDFTTYIPSADKESVNKAIKIGRKNKKALEKLDRELGTSIGRFYIQKRSI